MANRAMVMVAPNGARRGKADHPRLPVTASELAREAALCADAGAVAIHTHVRDEAGVHCLDVDRYREAIAAIRAECGGRLKIQITTEAVGIYSPQEQIACVKALRPDAASVALKEIVPDEAHEDRAREFFQWMRGEGVSAQIILYSAAEVERFWRLQEKGVTGFAEPFLLFVLGRYASDGQSEPREVDPFVAALGSHRANWAVCAFGRREAACAAHAASLGGHVRVGFENNLYLPGGAMAGSNAELVEASGGLIEKQGAELMGRDEAETIFQAACR